MRFSDKELAYYGTTTCATIEGRLTYRAPSGNFSQSGYKERWFKLCSNFLFYFRINDLMGGIDMSKSEPIGVFILENSMVQVDNSAVPFSFSLVFKDDVDKKHIFSARSEDQVHRWITAINTSSYEYCRKELRIMQAKIIRLTGKDPLLLYPHSESFAVKDPIEGIDLLNLSLSTSPKPKRPSRTTNLKSPSFRSHVKDFPEPKPTFENYLLPDQDRPNFPLLAPIFNNTSPTSSTNHIPPILPPPPTAPIRPNRTAKNRNSLAPVRSAPPPPSNVKTDNLIEF